MMLPVAALAAAPGAPAAPELKAAPDETGLFRVTLTVTSPTVTNNGSSLSSIDKIELRRDGSVIKVFDDVTPGEEKSFVDTGAVNGYAVYSASAFSSAGQGEIRYAEKVFVGVDTPLPPKNFRATAADNKITFYWAKGEKTGVNGERVRQDGLTYLLEALNDSYETLKTLSESKSQSFAYYMPVNSGAQDIARFGLRAYNVTGYSDYTYVRVITGAPYYFPYSESFAGGVSRGLCWQEGDGNFVMVTDDSADEDFGALACVPSYDGNTTSFNLGKFSMANTVSPRISFSIKDLAEGETFSFKIARNDGAEVTLLTVPGPVNDWKQYTVDLTPVKRESYIIPKFTLGASNNQPLYLDDIRLEDPYSEDLAIRVIAPETSYGQTEITAEVTNVGLNPAESAKVSIYTGGQQTSVLSLDGPLQPGESANLKAMVNIEGEESVEVAASVYWVYDVNPVNDKACAQIIPVKPSQGVTAGAEMTGEEDGAACIYTIDGNRINLPVKELPAGLYIIDGKKTVIY